MLTSWLAARDIHLSEESNNFRLELEGCPELLFERQPNGWLVALNLGPYPSHAKHGLVLSLLQANNPGAPWSPLVLTADGRGDILLYTIIDETVCFTGLDTLLEKFCNARTYFSSLIEQDAIVATPQTHKAMFG